MTSKDLIVSPRGLRFRGHYFPCTIGRGGITNSKKEGDGATPRGVHRIVDAFYRPDRMLPPCDWATPVHLGDLWCDDPEHIEYNHLVSAPFSASHEVMRRADPMYDLVLTTDWNWPTAEKGKGSAIFIHQWRRPGAPTAGCIGLDRWHLRWITARITKESRLMIL